MYHVSVGGPKGRPKYALGKATNSYRGGKAVPGQFYLTFEGSHSVGFYWVIAVGPIDPVSKKYTWSVVSTPLKTDLFILARDVSAFRENDQALVLDLVRSKGFTKIWNSPIESYQSSDCDYSFSPPEPSPPPGQQVAHLAFLMVQKITSLLASPHLLFLSSETRIIPPTAL